MLSLKSVSHSEEGGEQTSAKSSLRSEAKSRPSALRLSPSSTGSGSTWP